MNEETKDTHRHGFRIAGIHIDAMSIFMVLVIPVLIACVYLGTQLGSLQNNLLALGRVAQETVPITAPYAPTEVILRIQNTSTDTWYNSDNVATAVTLTTARPLGRSSALFEKTSWIDASHISLDQEQVKPGEIATFTFMVSAPMKDAYREYFVVTRADGTPYPSTEMVVTAVVKGVLRADALSAATWSTSGTALAGLVGDLAKINYSADKPLFAYEIVKVSSPISIDAGGTRDAEVTLRNTGNAIWYRDTKIGDRPLRLGTSRSADRRSRFYDNATWLSAGRINMTEAFVKPGETATFRFTLKAPTTEKAYREYFSPVVEWTGWIEQETDPIMIDVAIGNSSVSELVAITQSQSANPDKVIKVDLATQTMRLYEDDAQIALYPVSTGLWSMPTPTGVFTIENHARVAYSARYNLYMDYWQAITPDGLYGIHSLPYWKTRSGKLYEGEDHLGRNVSHGCIRLSPKNSEIVFNWTEDDKTRVEISGETPR